MKLLNISEIFYSLQGEGSRVGEPSIFIRLQRCSAQHACYASGIECDTEFESGKEWSVEQILEHLRALESGCTYIVWTGGEPADQLTQEIVDFFYANNYLQSIETSGTKRIPNGFDLVSISPKVAEHVLIKNFPQFYGSAEVKPQLELRYVRHKGQEIPEPKLHATHLFLSPHFDGLMINNENMLHCIRLALAHSEWRVSIQMHKIYNIL